MDEGGGHLVVLEEEFERFAQVRQRLVDGLALAGDLDLQAARDVPLTVLDHGGGQRTGRVHRTNYIGRRRRGAYR